MKARNSLASRDLVAELIRCTNDHSAMFTFAIWSRFSPPEFPNVWSAVSFCSNHASVLHGFSFLCLQCGNCLSRICRHNSGTDCRRGMATTATNVGKLLLSCGDSSEAA